MLVEVGFDDLTGEELAGLDDEAARAPSRN
jgi:hypothetical protein